MTFRITLLVSLSLAACGVASPRPLLSQPPRRGCDATAASEAPGYFESIGRYFWDPKSGATHIDQQPRTNSDEVVWNPGICEAVLNSALRVLRHNEPNWLQVERAGYRYTVFRYGEYYAIFIDYDLDPASGRPPAYVPVLVFRREGLSYITTILI